MKNKLSKINIIVEDADIDFKTNRFGESIQKRFLSIEKLAELVYIKLFPNIVEELDNNIVKVHYYIRKIESKLNIRIVDHKKLAHWRGIRNDVVHEYLKIKKQQAMEGRIFFDRLFVNLKKYHSTIVEGIRNSSQGERHNNPKVLTHAMCKFCGTTQVYDGTEIECPSCGVESAEFDEIPKFFNIKGESN